MTTRIPALPRERRTSRRGLPPLRVLIADLRAELLRLIRGELGLLRAELTEKFTNLAVGAGLFAGAALAALFALACLIVAAVAGLSLVLPAWLSAVLVAVGLLLLAGVLAFVGSRALKSAVPPIPDATIASIHDDVQAVTKGTP
jgi:hypothetical protein